VSRFGFSYDAWRLATPPEYERDEPPEADELVDELPCDVCDTQTLRVFLRPIELPCAPGALVCPGCRAAFEQRVTDIDF
jgi:hypothetical protein